MAEVHVVNEFGTVGTVPEEQLQSATASGYSLASEEQVKQAALQSEYGGVGGTAAAAAAGALRGGTVGISDVVAGELGLAEELQKLREANPNASMAGEVGGSLAGLGKFGAGTKGAGMLARGARLASAPARAVTQVGARIAGTGGGLIRAGAGAAFEGAVYGAGNAISESYLQNKELTAEALMASVGHGAALGGGLGFGAAGAGKLLSAGAKRTSNLLTRAIKRGGDPNAPGTMLKAVGALSNKSADDLARYGSREFRDMAVNAPRYIDDGIEAMTKEAAEFDAFARVRQNMFSGSQKYDAMAGMISAENAAVAFPAARAQMDNIAGKLDDLIASAEHSSSKLTGKEGLKTQIDALSSRLDRAIKEGGEAGMGKAYMAIDDAKRAIGNVRYKKMYATANTPTRRATADALDELYHRGPRQLLESGELWGKQAAGAQRAINEAWAKTIESSKVLGYGRKFSRRTGIEKGRDVHSFSHDQARTSLKELFGENNTERLQQFLKHIDNEEMAAKAVLDNAAGLPKSMVNAAKKTVGGAQAMRKRAKYLGDVVEAGQAHAKLGASSAQGNLSAAGLGLMLGSGLGPMGGAALGGAISAVRNPAGAIERFVALEQIAGNFTKKLTARTRALTKTTKGAMVKGSLGERTGRAAKRALVPAASQVHRGKKDRKRRYEQAASNLRAMTADANGIKERMTSQLAAIGQVAPGVVDMAVGKELAKAEYLQMHLPTSELPRTPFELPPVPSKVEMDSFLRRLDIVENPLSVIDKLEEGRLTHEHVDALRETAPAMYQEMRTNVMEGLVNAQVSGNPLPFQRRLQLGILLDMTTDRMMDPGIMADMQAMYSQERTPEQADNAAAPGAAPNVAGAYKTDSERLAQSG